MPIPYSNNTLHGGSINVDIDATGALEGETLYYDSTDAQFENNATLKIDPTTEAVNVAGDLALTRDGDTLKLGAGADFQAYHDGTNTEWINNTGDFIIRGEGGATRFMVNNNNLKVQDTTSPTPNDILVVDTANRRVGINVSVPEEDLHLDGNMLIEANGTNKITFYDTSHDHEHGRILFVSDGTDGGKFQLATLKDGETTADVKMVVDNAGKVGIGVDAPDEKLHLVEDSFTTRSVVKQETLFNGAVSIADCSNYAQSTLRSDGAVQDGDFLGSFNIGGGTTAGTQGDPSTFGATSGIRMSGKAKGDFSGASGRLTEFIIEKRTGASGLVNAFTIDKDNNVGIGEDTPDNTYSGLTIKGGDPSVRIKTTSAGGWTWTEYVNSSGTNNFSAGVNHSVPYYGIKAGAGMDSPSLAVDANGKVGIGLNNPSKYLEVDSGVVSDIVRFGNDAGGMVFGFAGTEASLDLATSNSLRIRQGSVVPLRINSDGHLLIGTSVLTDISSSGTGNEGGFIQQDGFLGLARSNDVVAVLNRKTSNGTLVEFRQDGTNVVGRISALGSERIAVHSGSVGIEFNPSNQVNPSDGTGGLDNVLDLGASGARWDDIFATNNVIQTSDKNEKTDIEELNEAEIRVAKKAKTLLRKYKWIKSVEEKGDDARIHFGIIAQDLEQAFIDEGLDAGRYGMFINSKWTDEAGVEHSRMGVRYNQLLAFIISGI